MGHVCIIGGGLAGLSAALGLVRGFPRVIAKELPQKLRISIIEAAADIGGRANTQSVGGALIDHGAQCWKIDYEKVRGFGLEEELTEIQRPVFVFEQDGISKPGDPSQDVVPKYTYPTGIQTIARRILGLVEQECREKEVHLSLKLNTLVSKVEEIHDEHGNICYSLIGSDETLVCNADYLILSQPAPLALQLIERSPSVKLGEGIIAQLKKVKYRQAISIAFCCSGASPSPPWYAAVNIDRKHPISWFAHENQKPSRVSENKSLFIAQMSPAYSEQNWAIYPSGLISDTQSETSAMVSRELAKVKSQCDEILGNSMGDVEWTHVHKWLHGLPYLSADNLADFGILNATVFRQDEQDKSSVSPRVMFCGDYTSIGAGRLHFSIASGLEAGRLLCLRMDGNSIIAKSDSSSCGLSVL